MNGEIVQFIKERGLLVEKDIFDEILRGGDNVSVKHVITNLEKIAGQKIITTTILTKQEYKDSNNCKFTTKGSINHAFIRYNKAILIKLNKQHETTTVHPGIYTVNNNSHRASRNSIN